eukprot:7753621-Heterocapsa_arctica.AAC.1
MAEARHPLDRLPTEGSRDRVPPPLEMHALVRGGTSQGVSSLFSFVAQPGQLDTPPGWQSVR